MKVTDKHQMYKLFKAGAFGNAGVNYADLNAAEKAPGPVMIRSKRPCGRCEPNVDPKALRAVRVSFWRDGYFADELEYSLMMPDHDLLLQGYAMVSDPTGDTLLLEYNDTLKVPMRQGMLHPKTKIGKHAWGLLRSVMDSESYSNFIRLVAEYPDHVIEFSVYPYGVGNLSWNTVFWEVRLY